MDISNPTLSESSNLSYSRHQTGLNRKTFCLPSDVNPRRFFLNGIFDLRINFSAEKVISFTLGRGIMRMISFHTNWVEIWCCLSWFDISPPNPVQELIFYSENMKGIYINTYGVTGNTSTPHTVTGNPSLLTQHAHYNQ